MPYRVATPKPAPPQPEINQLIYRWGEVADRIWVLVNFSYALNPTVVKEGTMITALFSSVDGQVTGSAGCNNYFASYDAGDTGDITSGTLALFKGRIHQTSLSPDVEAYLSK